MSKWHPGDTARQRLYTMTLTAKVDCEVEVLKRGTVGPNFTVGQSGSNFQGRNRMHRTLNIATTSVGLAPILCSY